MPSGISGSATLVTTENVTVWSGPLSRTVPFESLDGGTTVPVTVLPLTERTPVPAHLRHHHTRGESMTEPSEARCYHER